MGAPGDPREKKIFGNNSLKEADRVAGENKDKSHKNCNAKTAWLEQSLLLLYQGPGKLGRGSVR